MSTAIVIQARLRSKRLPRKVLLPVKNKPMISYLIERLRTLSIPMILAVPYGEDKTFFSCLKEAPINIMEGPHEDVLSRYVWIAQKQRLRSVIRVTADNPLTSRTCLRTLLRFHEKEKPALSYYKHLPYGAGCEIISSNALHYTHKHARDPYEREHVTPYLYKHTETFRVMEAPTPSRYHYPELRVTVDTQEDFNRFASWVDIFDGGERIIPLREVIAYERERQDKL